MVSCGWTSSVPICDIGGKCLLLGPSGLRDVRPLWPAFFLSCPSMFITSCLPLRFLCVSVPSALKDTELNESRVRSRGGKRERERGHRQECLTLTHNSRDEGEKADVKAAAAILMCECYT